MTAIGFVLALVGLSWIKLSVRERDAVLTPTGWVRLSPMRWTEWAQLAMVLLGAALIVSGLVVFLWRNLP